MFLVSSKAMKKLQNKKQNSKCNDILKYRKLFNELKLNEREIKEIKNHFEEMASLLVNIWLGKKRIFSK